MTHLSATDFSELEHAYGPATDLPARWARFRAEGDHDYELLHTICHQGTVYSATRAIVPELVSIALSPHRSRTDASRILGAILRASGGVHEQRALFGGRTIRNPATGELTAARGPDPTALAEERAWVLAMQREIASRWDEWLALTKHDDAEVRLAALELLAGVRHDHHRRARDVDAIIGRALAAARTEDERAGIERIRAELDA